MKISFIAMVALLGAATVSAAEPDPAQKAIAEELCSQSVLHKIVYDDDGNVIKLAITNHPGLRRDKSVPVPEPISAETFRKIVGLPKLQAIGLEQQKIGDAEYALLGQLKELRDVRLHNMGKTGGAATKDAPLFINDLPLPLEVLEIKHNFSIRGGCMDKLKPQPELWKLELDNGYCTNDAVPFIKQAPGIRNLQLHRTTISDDKFQEVLAALPNLEMLEVRPHGPSKNPITGRSLRGLKNHSKLQLLRLSLQWEELPFEGGLDALVSIPSLKYLVVGPSDIKDFSISNPELQKLHKARPDLFIRVDGDVLGGKPGDRDPKNDAESNWDGGVTTHG